MSYTIHHIEEGNIVCIRAQGRIELEEYKKGSIEVVEELRRQGSERLIADNRLVEDEIPLYVLYNLPKFFSEIGLPRSVRIALLLDVDMVRLKDFHFFETVCINKGYIVRSFYSLEEIMVWLKNE